MCRRLRPGSRIKFKSIYTRERRAPLWDQRALFKNSKTLKSLDDGNGTRDILPKGATAVKVWQHPHFHHSTAMSRPLLDASCVFSTKAQPPTWLILPYWWQPGFDNLARHALPSSIFL